tara:strand:+ start:1404 stop:1685 length:282 start_codon:yes stop_codon:yes gene_type:complete
LSAVYVQANYLLAKNAEIRAMHTHYLIDFIGEVNPLGLIANTELLSWLIMVSAVLPITNPAIPVRATVRMTIKSASIFLAILGSSSPAVPLTI